MSRMPTGSRAGGSFVARPAFYDPRRGGFWVSTTACCGCGEDATSVTVDLVTVTVGGVQRFIAEARSTADVAGASELLQGLVRAGAGHVEERLRGAPEPCGLVFPASSGDEVPVSNKLVFLTPAGQGAGLAQEVADILRGTWGLLVEQAFAGGEVPETPGMPDLSWAAVTGSDDDYPSLWAAVQDEMAGRRRARVFAPFEIPGQVLCAQSPGLPAVPAPSLPRQHKRDEKLSAAGWVKRWAGTSAPSTVSLASSSFRARLLRVAEADKGLRAELAEVTARLVASVEQLPAPREHASLPWPVEGLEPLRGRVGPWVYPSRWDVEVLRREFPGVAAGVAAAGRVAASRLVALAAAVGVPPPSSYLAVLTQDLDRLGPARRRCRWPPSARCRPSCRSWPAVSGP